MERIAWMGHPYIQWNKRTWVYDWLHDNLRSLHRNQDTDLCIFDLYKRDEPNIRYYWHIPDDNLVEN